jgi:hypothetical protein
LPAAINRNDSVWSPALASRGILYFMRTDATTGRFRLQRASGIDDEPLRVADLPFSTGAANDVDPYVTPDEDVLVFSSDRDSTIASADAPGPERLFVVFAPRAANPLVCPLRVRGWEEPSISMVEARLGPGRRTLYFTSRRLVHAPGLPANGPWDTGKANVWSVPFDERLWAFPGASRACADRGRRHDPAA